MLESRLREAGKRRALAERQRLSLLGGRLDALSPLKVMARGYAVVFLEEDARLVRSAKDVRPGDSLSIRLAPRGAGALSDCEEIGAVVKKA